MILSLFKERKIQRLFSRLLLSMANNNNKKEKSNENRNKASHIHILLHSSVCAFYVYIDILYKVCVSEVSVKDAQLTSPCHT